MTRVGLLSDTHSYFDPKINEFFKDVDLLIHGGDFGSLEMIDQCKELCSNFIGVSGNIDNIKIKAEMPLDQSFMIEDLKVFMTHIGGYPGRYTKRVRSLLEQEKPDLYICGHSHILKVMRDKKLDLLHMNPGACGHAGFHAIRTLLRFSVEGKEIDNLEVIELGKRGKIS